MSASRRLLPTVLLLAILTKTSSAWACACCDTTSDVTPIGWSPSGNSMLLRHENFEGCQRKIALEVHNVGASGPAACHDLLGNPELRIDCQQVSTDHKKQPGHSSQEQIYHGALRSIDPSFLHITYVLEPHQALAQAVPYRVQLAGSSQPIATLTLHHVNAAVFKPGKEQLNTTQMALLPVPGQQRAALLVRGIDTQTGSGHRGWLLRWVQLPKGHNVPVLEGVHWAFGLHDLRQPRPNDPPLAAWQTDKATSTRENNAGFKFHQQGDFANAARHFTAAVNADPLGATLARYNLACALARLGLPDRAMLVLQHLLSNAPPEVAKKRRDRAKVDDDLVQLRTRVDFQNLVCQGVCPDAPAKPAVAVAAQQPPTVDNAVPAARQAEPAQPQPAPNSAAVQVTPSEPKAKGGVLGVLGCSAASSRGGSASWAVGLLGLLVLYRRRQPSARLAVRERF